MNELDKLMHQIDGFFASKEENERYAYLFLPILLIGFLVYYFVIPITTEDLKSAEDKNKELKSNIQNTTNKINRVNSGNMMLNRKIKEDLVKIKKLKKEREEFSSILKYLDMFSFDITRFADIYNKIPNMASSNNLKILSLDSVQYFVNEGHESAKNKKKEPVTNQKDLIKKKMGINIKLSGDFMNVVKFVGDFEKRKELLKVTKWSSDINISTVSIDIYGADLKWGGDR